MYLNVTVNWIVPDEFQGSLAVINVRNGGVVEYY